MLIVIVSVPYFIRMPPSVPGKELVEPHAASQALIQAERFEKGSTLWIEDEKEAWVMVRVLGQENTLLRVCNVESGEEQEIDLVSFGVCMYMPSCLAIIPVLFCDPSCRDLQMSVIPIPKWLLT